MSLNATPSADRIHIGIFGRRNAGKSSIINAITGQDLAIVSEIRGTTTDPVFKSMELLPLGPVVLIDTPGLDDDGELGRMRIRKAFQVLNRTDIAVLVLDASIGMTPEDEAILKRIREKQIPCLIVRNKTDLLDGSAPSDPPQADGRKSAADPSMGAPEKGLSVVSVSAATGENIQELKEALGALAPEENGGRRIVGDLLKPSDLVLLVVPIDSAAPKGRLILPQQQTIRDILDAEAAAIVVKETGIREVLSSLKTPPALVVTDSQVFEQVAQEIPEDLPLTSFSILFARLKGNLDVFSRGARMLDHLEDGGRILISEGCTHHRQCDDIGTVKLPRWIRKHSGKNLEFVFSSGRDFPDDLSGYSLIIHCGGCMLNEREIKYRIKCAEDAGTPITNYGMAIAYMHGILERSIQALHR